MLTRMEPVVLEIAEGAASSDPDVGLRAVAALRALAERLLRSLEPDVPSQLHPAWREELRRRAAQIDAGEVRPVPWEEVKRRAWEVPVHPRG